LFILEVIHVYFLSLPVLMVCNVECG